MNLMVIRWINLSGPIIIYRIGVKIQKMQKQIIDLKTDAWWNILLKISRRGVQNMMER